MYCTQEGRVPSENTIVPLFRSFFTSNIMLPAGALFIVVFAGWIMCRNSTSDELKMGSGMRFMLWRVAARYIAPLAIILIFLHSSGLLGKMTGG